MSSSAPTLRYFPGVGYLPCSSHVFFRTKSGLSAFSRLFLTKQPRSTSKMSPKKYGYKDKSNVRTCFRRLIQKISGPEGAGAMTKSTLKKRGFVAANDIEVEDGDVTAPKTAKKAKASPKKSKHMHIRGDIRANSLQMPGPRRPFWSRRITDWSRMILRLMSSRSSQSVSSFQPDFGKMHTNGLIAGKIDKYA